MRHKKGNPKLSRQKGHRKALLSNLAKSFLRYEKIRTTERKAKELVKVIDHLITLSKGSSLYNRRRSFSILQDEELVKKLFTEIAPRYTSRKGGYTRMLKTDFRKGDGAEMVILELITPTAKSQ